MFSPGDRVRFTDPLNGEETEGNFLEVAVGEPIEVPGPESGTRLADAAWVRRDDGTTARVVYEKLRPA